MSGTPVEYAPVASVLIQPCSQNCHHRSGEQSVHLVLLVTPRFVKPLQFVLMIISPVSSKLSSLAQIQEDATRFRRGLKQGSSQRHPQGRCDLVPAEASQGLKTARVVHHFVVSDSVELTYGSMIVISWQSCLVALITTPRASLHTDWSESWSSGRVGIKAFEIPCFRSTRSTLNLCSGILVIEAFKILVSWSD